MSRFTRTVTVTRNSSGSYVQGVWVQGATETFTITASIQPATGRDIDALPEGRREYRHVNVYTDTRLIPQDDDATGDVIDIDGENFEVVTVESWQLGGLPHYEAIAEYRK